VADVSRDDNQLVIEPLRAALKEQSDTSLRTAAQSDLAEREVTIMGDKGTPFTVLKKVMATATAADYGKVSLAVIQREIEVGTGS
jgi:biopolymer transport protein ExbD